jgi:hypothetical protein
MCSVLWHLQLLVACLPTSAAVVAAARGRHASVPTWGVRCTIVEQSNHFPALPAHLCCSRCGGFGQRPCACPRGACCWALGGCGGPRTSPSAVSIKRWAVQQQPCSSLSWHGRCGHPQTSLSAVEVVWAYGCRVMAEQQQQCQVTYHSRQ